MINPFTGIRDKLANYLKIREAGGTSGQITNANIKNFVIKSVGNVDESLTQEFNSPASQLNENRYHIDED